MKPQDLVSLQRVRRHSTMLNASHIPVLTFHEVLVEGGAVFGGPTWGCIGHETMTADCAFACVWRQYWLQHTGKWHEIYNDVQDTNTYTNRYERLIHITPLMSQLVRRERIPAPPRTPEQLEHDALIERLSYRHDYED